MTTLEIFTAIRDAARVIPLDDTPGADPLFEVVELAGNRDLPRQLQELLILKKRACLIVPVAVRRTVADEGGQLSILGTKLAEIAFIYSDQAYFKPTQAVAFGSDKNLGLFGFDEKLEAALNGREFSPFGGIVFADSQPVLFTAQEQAQVAGRMAWFVTVYVPVGLIESAVA